MKSVFPLPVVSCLLHCRYIDRTNILWVNILVWIIYQDCSAQMWVEPSLDFNIFCLLNYSNSWQYVLVLSFNVILPRPTSEKVIPILSTGQQEEKYNVAFRVVTLFSAQSSAPVVSALC